ncbi:hypothetical protein [Alcanivorax sp.]|uniref:hypothetical protein n=1 Tax=Alcanivorax sp. TaxID=1872427 RepID=UPI0026384522|nr:hypothetical protein [Alcanivorax sp.]
MKVKVKFQYAPKGRKPCVGTQVVMDVPAKTESAVMAGLKKKHPNWEMIILEINSFP